MLQPSQREDGDWLDSPPSRIDLIVADGPVSFLLPVFEMSIRYPYSAKLP
ncbi:MAG: hypothetical protein U0R19_12945 [Bryobacteraceae bacterium]